MAAPIVCLGECLVDRLFQGSRSSSHPDRPGVDYPGGAPANVATAIAKLGTPTQLVSCIGEDDLGDWLIEQVAQPRVQCHLQRTAEAPTRVVLVERDDRGDRRFVGFNAPDPATFADTRLTPEWIDTLDFSEVAYLVLGTLGLAYPSTAAAMRRACDRAQAAGTKIIIDLNWRSVFWPNPAIAAPIIQTFLTRADLLKLSIEEAQWLLNTDSATAICQHFPQVQAVLLTAGAQGCTYATPRQGVTLPAFAVDSVDTTGAGDAFLAGVLHQLYHQGWYSLDTAEHMQPILRYASAVGALTTLQPGAIAAQPTPQAVDEFLQAHL